jgi:hypothetical protein
MTSENRLLRRIFGPKRDEVTGDWRRLHNEELHNSSASPNIIRVIKSRRMRWAEHVGCVGEMINTIFWLEALKGRDHSENLGVDGKIILVLILEKQGGNLWSG